MSFPKPPGGLWTPPEVSTVPGVVLTPSEGFQRVLAAFRGPFTHEPAEGALASLPVACRAWEGALRYARRSGHPTTLEGVQRALAERPAVARVGMNGIEAFVSASYVPFDDHIAIAKVMEGIERSRESLVRSLVVREVTTGGTTTMRFSAPRGAFAVRKGDVYEPGVVVTNSGDGTTPFVIAPASWGRFGANWFLPVRSRRCALCIANPTHASSATSERTSHERCASRLKSAI